jgi:hypothetical protein
LNITKTGLEPAIPATKRQQTYALDRAATDIGTRKNTASKIQDNSVRVQAFMNIYTHIILNVKPK